MNKTCTIAKEDDVVVIKIRDEHCEIDSEFVPVVAELNRLGLVTTGCCAGHKKEGDRQQPSAYLAFDTKKCDVLLTGGHVHLCWRRPEKPAVVEIETEQDRGGVSG